MLVACFSKMETWTGILKPETFLTSSKDFVGLRSTPRYERSIQFEAAQPSRQDHEPRDLLDLPSQY
jgi:hypothetical protein